MKNLLTATVIFFTLLANQETNACTSAIITGKATQDGRPLMWKHRDTDNENNRIVYINGKKYSFIGLVNSNDKNNSAIWAGTNSAGFCIMNTASYNLKCKNDTTKAADCEGEIMRRALEICVTTKDFETFLDTIKKPMGVEANFGVIDAFGGAAYYETNNFSYTKFDANESENGYIIRTNYSCTGETDKGLGYVRDETAKHLFAAKRKNFTPQWILETCSRSFYNSVLKTNLMQTMPQYAVEQDYITRESSSASIVFQGVKNGENPQRTTMWTVLGYPTCSIVFPLWVKAGDNIPQILAKTSQGNNAPLCDKVVELKQKIYPIKRGNGSKYMNFEKLYNASQTGIIQKLQPYEKEIFDETYENINSWDKNGWNKIELDEFYKKLNEKITSIYKNLFDL